MSDVNGYQHKFRLDDTDNAQAFPSRVTKRNRTPVSCYPCRSRKLRCNREQPACSNCSKRGVASSCSYASTSTTLSSGARDSSKDSVKRRVDELEKLLLGLVSKTVDSKTREKPEAKDVPEGSLTSNGDEATYVGATHWAAVLDNIRELRFSLDGPEPGVVQISASRGTSIFHVGPTGDLKSVIDAYMPPQSHCNRLLSLYLNSRYAILPSIHCPTFQRMYDAFWQDPHSVPIMWVAQLFGVLFLSNALSAQKSVTAVPHAELAGSNEALMKACVRCLELGDYTRPQQYAVEALLIYAQCMFWSTPDPGGELWMLFGMLVRLAIRMGYHQDPEHLPNLTPFQGEMRRRTWLVIRQFDLLGAWQHGLPCMIRGEWSSTKRPRNLLDTDFGEDTLTPPARPNTFLTVVLWEIAKDDLYTIAAQILDEQLSQTRTSPESVKRLDESLRAAHDAIPTILKCKPMSSSLADPADLIMMRVKTETLYQKALCILYRNSLKYTNATAQSRTICADSAMSLLENLNNIFEGCQPGGQMSSERWMMGSIHLSDFFLGATVLCWIQSSEQQEQTAIVLPREKLVKMNYLLLQSYQYCVQQKSRSREAHQVANALRVILSRLQLLPPSDGTPSSAVPDLSVDETDTNQFHSMSTKPDIASVDIQPIIPDLPIDNLFASTEDIDWTTFDQYFAGQMDDTIPDPNFFNLEDLALPQIQMSP